MNNTLFPLESTPQRNIDPQPRLSKKPRWAKCKCGQHILEAIPTGGQETHVDPINLTPASVQAAHLLARHVYRANPLLNGMPEELWWTHPADQYFYPHHDYYWLPEHQCHTPPLPSTPLNLKQTTYQPPTDAPY